MKFSNYKLNNELIKALESNGFKDMTEVQKNVIPKVLKGKKVIVNSPSGSGKTLAFITPMINNIKKDINEIQGLILAPTTELVKQIYNVLKQLTDKLNIKVSTLDKAYEYKKSDKLPKIVVATPKNALNAYNNYNYPLTTTNTIVLDEVDMVIELGFLNEIEQIISKSKKGIIIHCYSATIAEELQNFIKKYIKGNIEKISLKETVEGNNVIHSFINVKERSPIDYIEKQIIDGEFNPYMGIIFAYDKKDAEALYRRLLSKGIKSVALISSDNEKRQRLNTMKRIENNEYQYIIATDVASRGIDISGLSHVVHLGTPYDLNYYIHRCGRTGRFMSQGESLLVVNKDDMINIKKISERYGIEFRQIKSPTY